jgi:hypothetical protein
MSSTYQTQRTLKRFWRTEGNPRLRGLLLAGLPNSGYSPKDVGDAWIVDPDKRKRQLAHVPQYNQDGGRVLKAPVSQQYSPGIHEEFENSNEEAVARTLARDEFGDDDQDKFLAGSVGMDKDKYIKRALLNNSVTELDVLFREELETTLIQGAAPRKIARDAANVINVNNRKGDLPRGSDQGYAPERSQGATIESGRKSYDTVSFTTKGYATGFEITDQLVTESEPDIMEAEVRAAGARVENAINRVFLNNLVDNANQEFDTAGSNQDVTMVNNAIEQVELQDFIVDTMVQHPEFKTDLFTDSNLAYANRAGSDDVVRNGEFSPLLGLEMFTASDGTHNGSETWGFNADGEMGAVAYQRDHAALVVWEDFDMDSESYEDPIRRLQGGNVESWVDSVYRQSDAAARIEF